MSWAVAVVALMLTCLLQIYLHGMTGRVLAMRRQNEELLAKQAQLQAMGVLQPQPNLPPAQPQMPAVGNGMPPMQ